MKNVVIAGAGITGCFTAYFLGRLGIRTTLVERSKVADQASGHNPGGLNPLHGPGIPGPMLPLALRSFRLHHQHAPEIARLSGSPAIIQRVSRIELAFDESESIELSATRDLYEDTEGFAARWMDQRSLLAEEPRCHPDAAGGLFLEGNGMIESASYTAAACQAAQKLGVELRYGAVLGLKHAGSRVNAVTTSAGEIGCDALVLATGPFMEEAERWLGLSIPVRPLKGQLLRAALPDPPFRHHLTWKAIGVYHLPGGNAWLGGTQENAGYDLEPTAEGREAILEAVSRLAPCLRDARILSHEAALRPSTPDGLPLLGRAPGWDNVFLASGAGTKGMLLGAGLGEAAACLVADCVPLLNMECFSPERFNPPVRPVVHHNSPS
ncbi:MAG TPA: FAD-dependent oxidoreductase [Verrucomicrobiales bacterium]|nr:FAD-dependent oxidoreductase [Verrucomicrobiales bacterium]